ncbi:hypothetical protein Clacol_000130 [Clathrus columnatus]|uniref:Uncharacterized protein n=1 Tax=Clathrus columnatus TaxID=1419009 RepID=A0AAV4ZXX0_9AGAM|nr:hypothetical protein Clacol_000130 [Clathrus columnatus]
MEGDGSSASASFHGSVADQYDAALLVTAARLGFIPRFRRRLDLVEQRALIHSGSVFLWNEEESYMKRWTDGYPWSPSRVQNKFLVYREMTKRGGARSRTAARLLGHTPESSAESQRRKYIRNLGSSLFNRGELEYLEMYSNSGYSKSDDIFKRGGLIKKTYTITLPKETWHVVAYYTLEDVLNDRFTTPSESPLLRHPRILSDVTDVLEGSSRATSFFGTSTTTTMSTLRIQTPLPWTTPFLLDSPIQPKEDDSDLDLDSSSAIQDQNQNVSQNNSPSDDSPIEYCNETSTSMIDIIPDSTSFHSSHCYPHHHPLNNDPHLNYLYSLPPSPVVFTSSTLFSLSTDCSDYIDGSYHSTLPYASSNVVDGKVYTLTTDYW